MKIKLFIISILFFGLFQMSSFANKNIKYPDVIFFDWDGTISDNAENLSFAFGNALLKYGATKEELQMIRDNERQGNLEYIWQWAEEKFDKTTFNKMEKHYHFLYKHVSKINYTLSPRVIDFLKELKKRKIPSIVISNRNGNAVRLEAKNNNLKNYFNGIFGEHDFKGIVKPNSEYMKLSAKKLGIKYKTCWIIGDGETDIEQGLTSECKIFFVGKDIIIKKNKKYQEMKENGTISVVNYEDLIKIINL
jgi:HAD superfamily hydrolase (TIGR01549 family)